MQRRPVKYCFRARTCRRYRSDPWARSLISERESITTRDGRTRSISARIALVVAPSSISVGLEHRVLVVQLELGFGGHQLHDLDHLPATSRATGPQREALAWSRRE